MKKVITTSNYEVIPLDFRTNVRFYTSVDFGSYVPPHWHDAIEILYLQEGELKVNTEGTSRNLRSGQCTLIQPGYIPLSEHDQTKPLYFRFQFCFWKDLFPMPPS